MKKLLIVFFAATLLFAFVACNATANVESPSIDASSPSSDSDNIPSYAADLVVVDSGYEFVPGSSPTYDLFRYSFKILNNTSFDIESLILSSVITDMDGNLLGSTAAGFHNTIGSSKTVILTDSVYLSDYDLPFCIVPDKLLYEINGDTQYLELSVDSENAKQFTITIESTNQNSTESSGSEADMHVVYNTFVTATTLTKADLTKKITSTGTKYYYLDLPLLSEDVEWIDNPINKNGTVNQGAIYRKLAKLLAGYTLGLNNGSSYSKYIFGDDISTNEFGRYASIVSEFITNEDSLYHILKKFESLACVEGNFDYANNYWSFSIADLPQCAKEMQISEEMLGFIFALLDEYAPIISFDGNSCTFELKSSHDFGFDG
jgi:hypothetical protein